MALNLTCFSNMLPIQYIDISAFLKGIHGSSHRSIKLNSWIKKKIIKRATGLKFPTILIYLEILISLA
jgi:hypothetical protein